MGEIKLLVTDGESFECRDESISKALFETFRIS